MKGSGMGWVKEPCIVNGTRFDSVDDMIDENELDRKKTLAAFALGMTEFTNSDGFHVEIAMEDPDLESDRVRRTRNFPFPGWRDA